MSDPRLTGYLGRALSHEMAAVQQYLAQASLAALWGLGDDGDRFRSDAEGELCHAQALMERMLVLGIPCNATQLPAVRPGRNMEEMLLIDRVIEVEAVRLYDEAARYSARIRDSRSEALFSRLLSEELEHLNHLDKLLEDLDASGSA